MPRTVEEIDELQVYLAGVMDRAAHHAGNVGAIALAVAGAVIWRKDGPLRVMERDGEMKNVLWVTIGGQRYALSYHHDTATIQIRRGSLSGDVLRGFDNATPLADVWQFFASL